ncbi:hypothetical protein LOTGIDRAFT_228078 [Lottia gigantea]|uniref:Uncharacterized protein n=1 Tax=Lottia gigantea TaxID=225164 RepID=V4B4W7_LOTGI|nr:hypothetical protein LOTGIDRAFT_228078 [Lottia gigantea]ESP05538.1 hypothetical protein LOTGIDRAFT_228078 [Lottia gigantea]
MCLSQTNKLVLNNENTTRPHSALGHDELSKEKVSYRPYSAHQSLSNSQPPADQKSPIYTEIQVQIPKFEIEDSESARSRESDTLKPKSGKKGKSEKTEISRQPIKTRPFSAVDAYKTFVQQPSFPLKYRHGNRYRSDFQSRTTDLKILGKTQIEKPPPQRPPSPVNRGMNNNKLELRITRANNWLAGGRDVHKEMTRNRPKSGHVPGWKEGLPQTLARRPKSAMVPRSGRQSQMLVALTPVSIYEYGSAYSSTDLPELPSLSDYPSTIRPSPSPRLLGTLPSNHYLMS